MSNKDYSVFLCSLFQAQKGDVGEGDETICLWEV